MNEAPKWVLHEEGALSPMKLLGGSYAEAAEGLNPVCSNWEGLSGHLATAEVRVWCRVQTGNPEVTVKCP